MHLKKNLKNYENLRETFAVFPSRQVEMGRVTPMPLVPQEKAVFYCAFSPIHSTEIFWAVPIRY